MLVAAETAQRADIYRKKERERKRERGEKRAAVSKTVWGLRTMRREQIIARKSSQIGARVHVGKVDAEKGG